MLSIVISVIMGFVPLNSHFVFQRTFAFFPYFVLGYKMKQYGWWNVVMQLNKWWYIAVVCLYAVAIGIVPHVPLSMLEQFMSYWDVGGNPVLILAMRVASYCWQLPLALSMMVVISKVSCPKFMPMEGRSTLFYYVYHAYFVYWIHKAVCVYGAPSGLVFIVAYFMIVMTLLYMSRRIIIFEKILNPISSYCEIKNYICEQQK